MSAKDCVFCRIVKGELSAKKEYEDDEILAFHDINPIAPVHVLIIPKKHLSNLVQTQEEDRLLLGQIQLIAKKVSQKLKIDSAFRLLMANGQEAGQSVFHLHYHLTGGWKGHPPVMETK